MAGMVAMEGKARGSKSCLCHSGLLWRVGGVQSEVPINRTQMKLSSPGDKTRLKCFP